jgi:hypothetical protein
VTEEVFDRPALQRLLAEAEGRVADIERQIAQQRKLIAQLAGTGRDASYASAGLTEVLVTGMLTR